MRFFGKIWYIDKNALTFLFPAVDEQRAAVEEHFSRCARSRHSVQEPYKVDNKHADNQRIPRDDVVGGFWLVAQELLNGLRVVRFGSLQLVNVPLIAGKGGVDVARAIGTLTWKYKDFLILEF